MLTNSSPFNDISHYQPEPVMHPKLIQPQSFIATNKWVNKQGQTNGLVWCFITADVIHSYSYHDSLLLASPVDTMMWSVVTLYQRLLFKSFLYHFIVFYYHSKKHVYSNKMINMIMTHEAIIIYLVKQNW